MKRFIKGYVIGIVASMAIAIVPTAAIAEEVVPPSGNDEAIQSVEVADVSSLQEPAGQVAMDPEAENGITASALAPVTAEEGGDAPVTPEPTPTLTGSAHVQTFGWQPATAGEGGTVVLGTTGLSKRLEGLALTVEGGSISYKAHVQTYGWQDWRADGVAAGTEGESKRLEAIRIKLGGELEGRWSVQYRCHVQTFGWLGWTADGEVAGSTGFSKRLEAVEVRVVPAGTPLPEGGDAWVDNGISVHAHVQSYGWMDEARGYNVVAGTTGQAKRVEAFTITKPGGMEIEGDMLYRAHVQGIGWQDWVSNGELAGTTGQSRRVEAVQIDMTGELAARYDIWYRAHVQGIGWMGWTCNGGAAGTQGMSRRVEAIQVALVPEGAGAPEATDQAKEEPFLWSDFTSGDPSLDGILNSIVVYHTGEGSDALWRAYKYISGSFGYRQQNTWPGGSWTAWSKDYAKELYNVGSGNCYRFASLMCWTARRLGYDASVVCGEVLCDDRGWVPHGWCEVHQGGQSYVVDTEMHRYINYREFFMTTYDDAAVYYRL